MLLAGPVLVYLGLDFVAWGSVVFFVLRDWRKDGGFRLQPAGRYADKRRGGGANGAPTDSR